MIDWKAVACHFWQQDKATRAHWHVALSKATDAIAATGRMWRSQLTRADAAERERDAARSALDDAERREQGLREAVIEYLRWSGPGRQDIERTFNARQALSRLHDLLYAQPTPAAPVGEGWAEG